MRFFAVLILAAFLPSSAPLRAQTYPFSQRGAVSQRVAFTDFHIEYGRPSAKGRTLFGTLVPWDSIWHPGADLATQIRISRDITLEGQAVAKGVYTAWLIPRERAAWTFILNKKAGVQHTPYPGKAFEALRVDVTPDEGARFETLTYFFPLVLKDEATLRIQWGTTGITMRVKAAYLPK